MTVRLSIAIQNHPKRALMGAALAQKVGGTVVTDPAPDEKVSPWRTYRRALELTPRDATHRLILQDDMIVCHDFTRIATRALEHRPDSIVMFCVCGEPNEWTRPILNACSRDETWVRLRPDRYIPVLATCWPVRLVRPLLTYVDGQNRWPKDFVADDEIAGDFARSLREMRRACVPSLADHPVTQPSIIRKGEPQRGLNRARVAVCYIGDCETCPDEIDWTTGDA